MTKINFETGFFNDDNNNQFSDICKRVLKNKSNKND